MRKDRLYLLTLTGLTLIVFLINLLTINQLIKVSTEELLKGQLESSRREASEISKILATQLSNGISKDEVASGLQRSIENTSMESGFICMYNTSGIEICHPNTKKIGQKITLSNSNVAGIDEGITKNFYNVLKSGKASGGIRDFLKEDRSEIIYVYPVKNTDWMVAAHANISSLQNRLSSIKVNIILINSLAAILIILLSFIVVRWVGSKYERGIELEKEKLVDSLGKLNLDISEYKSRIEQQVLPITLEAGDKRVDEKLKRRVLTYWRDELVSIPVQEIAFCYTQNSLTYVHCLTKKHYNSNLSLDELFESLDKSIFFRANRQFVISIRSIEKVYRYGNNQLKIATNPEAPENIIISKNKASEFKDWLDA